MRLVEKDHTYTPVRDDPDWIKILAWVLIVAFVAAVWTGISLLLY